MIDINTKEVTTIAGSAPGFNDGTGLEAKFETPTDVAVFGENIVVADHDNNRIRKIDITTKNVTTIADNGEGVGHDMRVAIDHEGNIIFNDKVKTQLRKIAAGW
jgi:DNA-binding beta-propeller fold protein YncE